MRAASRFKYSSSAGSRSYSRHTFDKPSPTFVPSPSGTFVPPKSSISGKASPRKAAPTWAEREWLCRHLWELNRENLPIPPSCSCSSAPAATLCTSSGTGSRLARVEAVLHIVPHVRFEQGGSCGRPSEAERHLNMRNALWPVFPWTLQSICAVSTSLLPKPSG